MNMRQAAVTVKESVPIETAARYYGIEFDRSGFAICPFHSENTPSFKIHNNRGHCFGCGWDGDVIAFAQELFSISFNDAVRQLASDFGVPIYLDRKPTLREHRDSMSKYRKIVEDVEKKAQERAYKELHYNALWDIWCLLDKWLTEYAPQNPDDPFDERYVYAAQNIDYISYRIDTEL